MLTLNWAHIFWFYVGIISFFIDAALRRASVKSETPLSGGPWWKPINGPAVGIEVERKTRQSSCTHKAIKPDVQRPLIEHLQTRKNNCTDVCGPVELKGALTAASSALLMESSIPKAIMSGFFPLFTIFQQTSRCLQTHFCGKEVRVQVECSPFLAAWCYFKLSRCRAVKPPQLVLLPVRNESNHRMTSTGWWVLCKVPPTLKATISGREGFFLSEVPNHTTPQAQRDSPGAFVTLSETKTWDFCLTLMPNPQTGITLWVTSAAAHSTLAVGLHNNFSLQVLSAWDTWAHCWPHPVIYLMSRAASQTTAFGGNDRVKLHTMLERLMRSSPRSVYVRDTLKEE